MTHDNVTDIEARLRGNSCYNPQNGGMCDNTFTMREAASTIATLRKQLENAREALRDIARPRHGHQALAEDGKEQPKHLYPYYAGVVSQLQQKAREALKGQP